MTDETQMELAMQPRARVRIEVDPHDALPRTTWRSDTPPPCPGFWEVRHRDGDERRGLQVECGRWWWDGDDWRAPLTTRTHIGTRIVSHVTFVLHYEWRGLLTPSPFVYPCPPYDSVLLMKRAKELDVTVRTMYAAYTQNQRQRVRL